MTFDDWWREDAPRTESVRRALSEPGFMANHGGDWTKELCREAWNAAFAAGGKLGPLTIVHHPSATGPGQYAVAGPEGRALSMEEAITVANLRQRIANAVHALARELETLPVDLAAIEAGDRAWADDRAKVLRDAAFRIEAGELG